MDLRTFLDDTGLTQLQLAEMVSREAGRTLSTSLLSQWLTNRRPIGPRWVMAIQKATAGKCQPHELRPDIFHEPTPSEAA